MEEAELLKERLQAITKKRKIQEDIASKRLEIDREKMKLQQLKKKYARDLWLMGGASVKATQKEQEVLDVSQQTNALQSNIHRMEKEIKTLETEELNISTNEVLILSRLKTIEKSTEDIIKAANANFKSDPSHVNLGIPDNGKSYTPLSMRKKPCVDQRTKNEKHKPALFAMEINVQKDPRTGESRVLSTCTVPAQELQQRGIKVYDDGRKSVYALHNTLDQPKVNGVDELSPTEVDELLKQATEKRKTAQEQTKPMYYKNYQNSHCSELYNMDMSEFPELEYSQCSVHCPDQEIHKSAHMFHNYNEDHEDYHNSNGNSYEIYGGDTRSDPNQFYNVRDRDRSTQSQHVDSVGNYMPPLSYREDPKLSILNTLPSDEPVTMIFMGYQEAEEEAHSYEGSVQAEFVIIDDGEEETSTSISDFQKTPVYSLQDRTTRKKFTLLTSETVSPAFLNRRTVSQVAEDGTPLKGSMVEIQDG